jgi:hypothetical protein
MTRVSSGLLAWSTLRGNKTVIPLTALALAGLVGETWRAGHLAWTEAHRPARVYRQGIEEGWAVSLNALEQRGITGRLPRLELRGAVLDREEHDWILFGETAERQPELAVETVAIAFRTILRELESPGIDIRPARNPGIGPNDHQDVQYFGGVANTIVGSWFFDIDYWMKRASLGAGSAPAAGLPVYWHRTVLALEHSVASCTSSEAFEQRRSNRYWLCASDFAAVEGSDTIAFESTPLRVLAESTDTAHPREQEEPQPCVSRGTDDVLAAEFAQWLTDHLNELDRSVPVSQIAEWSRLLASIAWLAKRDPYRNVEPWLNSRPTWVDTPRTVQTLAVEAERAHNIRTLQGQLVHTHRVDLSGGVMIRPSLRVARAADGSLVALRQAILRSRFAAAIQWRFTFIPPSA